MRAIALVGFLALACAGTSEDDADAGMNDVTGSVILVNTTDTGETSTPYPLDAKTIAAHVPDGSGGFTIYPGTGSSDGTFRIPNVPAGAYYLEINSLYGLDMYIVTDLRVMDLRPKSLGRADTAYPSAQTNLVFNVTGLSAWQSAQDDLELYSVGAGAYVRKIEEPLQYGTTNFPTAGVTSLSAMTVDYRNTQQALVDGSKGDRAFFTQLVAETAGPTPYLALERAIELPSFTMQDGQPSTVSGAMTNVPQSQTADLSLKRAAWGALAGGIYANGQLDSFDTRVVAAPVNITVAAGGFADLVVFPAQPGSTDLNVSMTYGDPFPAGWQRFLLVTAAYSSQMMTPDSFLLTLTGTFDRYLGLSGGTISLDPVLGPVTSPTINGTSMFTDSMTGVGTTPTVAWGNPTLGTATATYVLLHRYTGSGMSDWISVIGTRGNSVTIPPGLLQSGQWYWVQVQSYNVVDDPDASFNLLSFTVPGAMSDVHSGFFTP